MCNVVDLQLISGSRLMSQSFHKRQVPIDVHWRLWNYLLILVTHLCYFIVISLKFVAAVIFIFGHWDISGHFWLLMLRSLLLTVGLLSAAAWTIATVCCVIPLNAILISYNAYRILWHVLAVNLLDHPVLLASGVTSLTGYQLDNMLLAKPLWSHIKLWKQDNQFIYVTCFIIINQLVLWDPPVNY